MTPAAERTDDDVALDRLLRGRSPLLDVVADLSADVARATFPLDLPDAADARALRDRLATQITVHLLPRLRQAVGPAVVVVAGATGSGKSTLVNSVVGAEVSAAGLRRPTTHEPVLVAGPADATLLAEHPLAGLARLVPADGAPAGVALVDAPDLDSVGENRVLGSQLLEAADLWVFVTTAARYGDAVPWEALTDAQARGVSTAVVLNRVPAGALGPVRAHLLERLDSLGLGSAPLIIIPDVGPHTGPLPAQHIAELREWFELVGSRHQASGIVRRTNRAVWASLRADLLALAESMRAQAEAATALDSAARDAVEAPALAVVEEIEAGTAARGAPTTRWLAAASTGGPLAVLLDRPDRARRGWRGRALAARDAAAETLGAEADAAVTTLLADALRDADAAVRDAWRALPGSATLRVDQPDPAAVAREVVTAWAATAHGLAAGSTALSAGGVAALLRAAATGVQGAAGGLAALGVPAEAVTTVRTSLLTEAAAAVRGRAQPYRAAVEALALDAAAGTTLRLRASELKGHA